MEEPVSAETKSSDLDLGRRIVFLKSFSSSRSSVRSVGRWLLVSIKFGVKNCFMSGIAYFETEDSTVSIKVLRKAQMFGCLC